MRTLSNSLFLFLWNQKSFHDVVHLLSSRQSSRTRDSVVGSNQVWKSSSRHRRLTLLWFFQTKMFTGRKTSSSSSASPREDQSKVLPTVRREWRSSPVGSQPGDNSSWKSWKENIPTFERNKKRKYTYFWKRQQNMFSSFIFYTASPCLSLIAA